MFMFWSKRTVLTRRLLKTKVREEHETECEAQEDSSQVYVDEDTSNFEVEEANEQDKVRESKESIRWTTRRRATIKFRRLCCGGNRSKNDDEEPSRLSRCKKLLKSLKENQLEMLLTAVESYGADMSSCVLVPRENQETESNPLQHRPCRHHHHHHQNHYLRHLNHHHKHHHRYNSSSLGDQEEQEPRLPGEEPIPNVTNPGTMRVERDQYRIPVRGSSPDLPIVDPHLLCCQTWRWPDLTNASELKRLPVCHSAKDPVYICCNPYHWSRLCKSESPPPPYSRVADKLRPEDRAPSEGDPLPCRTTTPMPHPGSFTTNGEGELGKKEWCTLAYWELAVRVGRLYPVEPETVNIFDSLHDGDGLCLATLAENYPAPLVVQRTRSKIGLGLMLSQESDGVWAYNRSESPIFINSPTLNESESRTLLVYRVPTGYCLNIFDRSKIPKQPSASNTSLTKPSFPSGPVDFNSVRISFAKGWGPKYSRQEVTSCHCWLEVLLAPCR